VIENISYWKEAATEVVSTHPTLVASVTAAAAVLDPGPHGAPGLHSLMLPVLSLLMAQRDMLLVHAGGYLDAARGGAVLVLGGSGQGKSTAITAALSAGCEVLGDDMCVLTFDGGRLAAVGVPVPLALPGDLGDQPVVGAAIPGDPRQRRAPTVPPERRQEWHPVVGAVLVGHSTLRQGTKRAAAPRDTFHALMRSTIHGLADGLARYPFPYAAAVSRLPAWHLGHGSDSASRVAAARHWLFGDVVETHQPEADELVDEHADVAAHPFQRDAAGGHATGHLVTEGVDVAGAVDGSPHD
jgi:hypothetical protein